MLSPLPRATNANYKNMNQIEINGRQWEIRYSYQREDGTLWHVVDTHGKDGPFLGDFGDEWPA